ncbi:hypothetical protein B296_00049301 [Ensete ventricosum]|uniref:Uncharacterized protein n=1 Tax=Ensete ventricosum TaxID=4639 RepID=A0A426YRC4_ENSVE|nr:hypothetical protein B296_00049301 [Ensete ventricosum]
MLQRANQYTIAKALVAGKWEDHKRPHVEKPRGQSLEPSRRRLDRSKSSYPRPPLLPLSTTKTKNFLQIKETRLLGMPNPMKTPRELRDRIEELTCKGYLRRYVKRSRELPSIPHPHGSIEKQINVIIGRPMSGGDSVLGRKAYARAIMEKRPRQKDEPKIAFKVGETKYPEHDDALVVSVHIANAQVKMVMINTRTLANVLYFNAFQKLGLTTANMSPMSSTLMSLQVTPSSLLG